MKTFASIIAGLLLAVTVNGQTTTPAPVTTNTVPSLPEHVSTWLSFLSNTSSNWFIVPYGIYVDDDINSFGAGVGAFYKLSDYALTGLRLDYVNSELVMPSVNVQLQLPIKVANKLTVTPFAVSGLATPLDGRGSDDGTAVGILGAGVAVSVTKKIGVVYDIESWTSFDGTQHRFGVYWKF